VKLKTGDSSAEELLQWRFHQSRDKVHWQLQDGKDAAKSTSLRYSMLTASGLPPRGDSSVYLWMNGLGDHQWWVLDKPGGVLQQDFQVKNAKWACCLQASSSGEVTCKRCFAIKSVQPSQLWALTKIFDP